MGGADEGHILVGGLPQEPTLPFGYKLVFSIVGLLREYTDEARVVRDGKWVKVKPFSTVERYLFPPPIGELEGFCTDGLASLVYTMKGLRVLDEITLRRPGHAEKMNLLLESGFFSREKVREGWRDRSLTARSILVRPWEETRRRGPEGRHGDEGDRKEAGERNNL
jgi:lysine 6-dehydrogenase